MSSTRLCDAVGAVYSRILTFDSDLFVISRVTWTSVWLAGFDFSSCPMWSTCRNHPMYSLWRQASESVSAVTARILVQLCELLPLCDFPRSLTHSLITAAVCRNGVWQRHRAAERLHCQRLRQEQVERSSSCSTDWAGSCEMIKSII